MNLTLFSILLARYRRSILKAWDNPEKFLGNILFEIVDNFLPFARIHGEDRIDVLYSSFCDLFPVETPSMFVKRRNGVLRVRKLLENEKEQENIIWQEFDDPLTGSYGKVPLLKDELIKIFRNAILGIAAIHSKSISCRNLLAIPGRFFHFVDNVLIEFEISSAIIYSMPLLIRSFFTPMTIPGSIPGGVFNKVSGIWGGVTSVLEIAMNKKDGFFFFLITDNPYSYFARILEKEHGSRLSIIINIGGIPLCVASPGEGDFLLLPVKGVFLEFVPVERFIGGFSRAIPLWSVELERAYYPVISSTSGHFRLLSGKKIEFTSITPPRVRFLGEDKYSQYIMDFLPLSQVERALQEVAFKTEVVINKWHVGVMESQDNGHVHNLKLIFFLYFEDAVEDLPHFAELMDEKLCELNGTYRQLRRSILASCDVYALTPETIPLVPSASPFIREASTVRTLINATSG